MRVIRGSAFSPSLRSFVTLADCLGLPVESFELRDASGFDRAFSSSGESAVHVIDVASVAAALPADGRRLAQRLREAAGHALLFVSDADETTSRFLVAATEGALAGVRAADAAAARFEPGAAAPLRELAGHSYARATRAALVLDAARDAFEPILRVDGRPCFGRLAEEVRRSRVFVWATRDVFDMRRPLDAELEFEGAVDRFVPGLAFLRSAFGERCWHNPHADAALVIDDPLLRRRYGFLDFEKLLDSARRCGYRVTLGFIPWNHRRTRRADARFFLDRSDVFSLCVHGNDHVRGEFASQDYIELRRKAREAIERMKRHRARTGLPWEPLMVCPQERYSVRALQALADSGVFAAVSNTRRIPDDPHARGRSCGADLLLPAQDCWSAIPILKRHYSSEGLSSFALDLFLGRPAVLAEHHDHFRSGPEPVERFVDALDALHPGVRWDPPGTVVRRLRWQQRVSAGRWRVRFFADTFELAHESGETVEYLLTRRVPDDAVVEQVSVDGRAVAFACSDGMLRFEVSASRRAVHRVEVRRRLVDDASTVARSPSYRAGVALRRGLSELRDNVLSHSAAAGLVAHSMARGLGQTSAARR